MSQPATHEGDSSVAATAELRVHRVRALSGPNYWRLAPVVLCEVDEGELRGAAPADVPGLADRLRAALPTLAAAPADAGWPALLGMVALELQRLAGPDVRFLRVEPAGAPGRSWLAVDYAEEALGEESVWEALALVRGALAGDVPDAAAVVERLCALYRRVALGPTALVMVEEARRRGIPVRRTAGESVVQLGLGRRARRIDATMTDCTSVIATDITSDKDRTKRVLARVGLQVPRGGVARTLDEALEIVEDIGFPVILKPLDANNGRAISARIDDEAGVRAAWPLARAEHPQVVVERWAEGRDHRVVVVNGRVVAVAERVPAHVVGDGARTVRELIVEANRDPRRGKGPQHPLAPIPADEITAAYLARSGRTLDDVPAAGEHVQLRSTANISTGGIPIDRTDEIHPDNATACELAAEAVGLDVAGLDVLTPDISVPFRRNGAVIIEVNASPGIRMHTHPVAGRPRNVPGAILDVLFPPGTDPGVPIVAVTGTNGKTTTTRLIAHIVRQDGRAVGFTTTDGVYLRDRLVLEGDMTGPFAANVVLSSRSVDVAVLETARGGLLRAGLGFDECDVGVVLNVTPDHLGLGGIDTVEQLAALKGTVAAVVKRRGHAVLNADDPLVAAMHERTRGDVVYFSVRGPDDNPLLARHLAEGGSAALLQEEQLVLQRGSVCIPIADVRDVPLTVGGAARFQIENVLAAIAATDAQGVRYGAIRDGLLSFVPSPAVTPGRLNLLRAGHSRVLVDYAHNPAAVRGLVEFALRIDATRRVAVIGAPGDRRDDDLRAVGAPFAAFDRVITKDGLYPRGRAPGEIAALLAEGLRAAGMPGDRIEHHPEERDAIARALEAAGDGGLAVILADDVDAALDQLRPLTAQVV